MIKDGSIRSLELSAELGKVQRTQTRSSIPALSSVVAVGVAAVVVTLGDIAKSGASLGRVEKRVDESQVRLALALAVVVELGDEAGPGGSGSRGAADVVEAAVDVGLVELGGEGDVGVSAALGVEVALVGRVERVGVGGRVVGVVAGSGEVPRVAAAGGGDGRLEVGNNLAVGGELYTSFVRYTSEKGGGGSRRGAHLSTANSSNVRARRGPGGVEAVGAVVVGVDAADAVVARGEEDRDALGAGLHELVAHAVHVAAVKVLLLAVVRGRDSSGRVGGRGQVAGQVGDLVGEALVGLGANGEELAGVGVANASDELKSGLVRRVSLLYVHVRCRNRGNGTHLSVEVALGEDVVAARARVAAARDRDVLEVLETGDVSLTELGVVGVRAGEANQEGRGDESVALAGVVDVVERLDTGRRDGGLARGGGRALLLGHDGLGLAADRVVEGRGGRDHADHLVQALGHAVLGGAGDGLGVERGVGGLVEVVGGVEHLLHGGHGGGELDPAKDSQC